MDAATVTQAGAGEPTVMRDEADMVQAAKQGTRGAAKQGARAATKQGPRGAAKTQIRARIVHVGSEYRRDVASGTCELCIAEWTARIRDITVEFTDLDTGATWKTITPTLHVGPWNDIWEVRVNPFVLSKALPHVTLTVDARRLADVRGRTLIALAILESAEALDHASAIVDRLDGAYIHNDDWDEEGLPWLSWGREEGSYAGR